MIAKIEEDNYYFLLYFEKTINNQKHNIRKKIILTLKNT